MSVNAISNDGGLGQWQFLSRLQTDQPISTVVDPRLSAGGRGIASDRGNAARSGSAAGSSDAATNARAPGGVGAGAQVAGGPGPSNWLSAVASAGGTLIAALQTFLTDLQGAGTQAAGTQGAGTQGAGTGGAGTGGAAPTTAPVATTGASTGGTASSNPTGSAAATGGTGTTIGTDAASLIAALQSFVGLLQGERAASTGSPGAAGPAPGANGVDGHRGWHRHHHFGGGGGGFGRGEESNGRFGDVPTTSQLLSDILGAIQSYAIGSSAGSAASLATQASLPPSSAAQFGATLTAGTSISV